MIYLKTQNLILRDFKENDIDELYDYRNNEQCSRYQRGQKHIKEDLISLIKRTPNYNLDKDNKKQFAIAFKESDSLLGDLVILLKGETLTIGYTISYKYHRKGYGFEILSALLKYLRNEYPDKEIVALTDKDNIASIKLLEKLNFNNEGYLKDIASLVFSFSA